MSQILRIDLSSRTAALEAVPSSLADLGGRGLTSAIVAAEVPPKADPLGRENKLVLAPGLLAATPVPNTGRLSVGAKSPLTGTIKEANSGGAAAQKLARLGIAAVVLEGAASEPVVVSIDRNGATVRPAGTLWGLGSYDAVRKLRAEYPSSAFALVGPAGERGLKAASVCVTTPDDLIRTASRGGMGAVMGKKNVKAIAVNDEGAAGAAIADAEGLKKAAKALTQGVLAHPLVGGFQALGTALLVPMINEMGGLPTRNFSTGQFEKQAAIGGEALAKIMSERKGATTKHSCMPGCVIHCSQVYTDPQGAFVTSGLEYETIVLTGSNCAVGDPDQIARIDRTCDDLGLDTMEIGAAVGVAMEGGKIPWGDGRRVVEVLESIRRDDSLGLLIGNGCRDTGKALGVARVPQVKGQGLAAYDPRVLKGTGVTYATCPMGADHTAGNALPSPANPSYNPGDPKGQNQMSEFLQAFMAAVDTLGLCLFASVPMAETPGCLEELVAAVAAKTGRSLAPDYLIQLGRQAVLTEREFNRRAGFTPADDRLPRFFYEEALQPGGGVWDVADADVDQVFAG
ncbi:MAG: aldehyde ferredoxin oxidoreductase [Deltaproteobacteria bacterium]|nr:aldehyde ferredoxin oxidoreductase [Deltaproteobacteria bacterium]